MTDHTKPVSLTNVFRIATAISAILRNDLGDGHMDIEHAHTKDGDTVYAAWTIDCDELKTDLPVRLCRCDGKLLVFIEDEDDRYTNELWGTMVTIIGYCEFYRYARWTCSTWPGIDNLRQEVARLDELRSLAA
jgi:hypothetical protein